MKLKLSNSIIVACIIITLCGCSKTVIKSEMEPRVMDPITETPEWLVTLADKVLSPDSLNVWIPTGDLSTSSLIRVPRFPSLRRDDENEPSPFDIKAANLYTPNKISAVRNEQQSFQIAVASVKDLTNLTVYTDDFVSDMGDSLKAEVKVRFVRYVPVERARSELIWSPRMEDVFGKEVSGFRSPDVVADPLMEVSSVDVPAYRAQPVWFTVQVPPTAKPGNYTGNIHIKTKEFSGITLPVEINVLPPVLPSPEGYAFFLDLWFNPNAVAAVNKVNPWSEDHWKSMIPYIKDLASHGSKTVTTTIVPYPWKVDWLRNQNRSQTAIGYPSMVTWLRDKSGQWSFDYSVFDRFVDTCFKYGIDKRIDAFSLTPFHHKGGREIIYRHKEDNTLATLNFDTINAEYETIWKTFLRDFVKHLNSKGWLNKTYLSFDESPNDVIKSILDIVSDSAPVFLKQFSIAGRIDTEPLARSLSLFYSFLPDKLTKGDRISDILQKRHNDTTLNTTYYLCGDPAHPNSFTYSPAIESRMIPWLSAYYNVDGYLRWAYNSWSDVDPYSHPVFNCIQGDDYYIYPGKNGPVSSIRWELLKEGIEDFELLRILDSPMKQEAINLAVRNRDGRNKNVTDFEEARKLLFK